jgi:hypothetical protein
VVKWSMKFLRLFMLLSLAVDHLSAATFSRTPTSTIKMSEACSKIAERQSELKLWTEKTDQRSCTLEAPKPAGKGTCTVDITDCLPHHVQKYQGRNPDIFGPNCWNLALVMAGILPGLRASSPNEWELYLKSDMCRALSSQEQPQVGDLGSLEEREEGSRPVQHHGFIYVSPELVYSKNGQGEKIPYALQPFKVMAKANNVDGYGGVCDGEGCPKGKIFYYRCENFETYFKKLQATHKEELKKISDEVAGIECLFEGSEFDGKASSEVPALLTASVEALAVYLKEASKSWEKSSPEERMLINSFSMRLSSIQESLGNSPEEKNLRQLFAKSRSQLPR